MLNPVLTPDLALMLKRGELMSEEIDIDDEALQHEHIETIGKYQHDSCDALTVQDEPFDLASEIMPSIWDRYIPNDGTSANERLLRKQGFRKADDSTREQVQELTIELMRDRRTVRVHILRQKGGDIVLN